MGASDEIRSISAVTLAVADMGRALGFYQALGFRITHGGPEARFCTLEAGSSRLNLGLLVEGGRGYPWGRVIFRVRDVDAFHRRARARGIEPEFSPRDADWGERYFHVTDPDGHELSFAASLGAEP